MIRAFPQQIVDIADFVAQQVQLVRQALNLGFGAPVDLKSSSPRSRSFVSWRFWLIMMTGA